MYRRFVLGSLSLGRVEGFLRRFGYLFKDLWFLIRVVV